MHTIPQPQPDARPDERLRLSPLVLGLWRAGRVQLPRPRLVELIAASLDVGIDTFDLADIYGNYAGEQAFGDALAASRVPRDRVRLVSKGGVCLVSDARPAHRVKHYDNGAAHLRASLDASLQKLRTDHLDLFLVHRPDFLFDADELADTLRQMVRAGKARHVGVSNFSPSQQRLLAARLPELAANQIELSVLRRAPFEDGTLDLCQEQHCIPMAWSPLGGGALFTADAPDMQRLRTALAEVGEALGSATPDQVALAWLMRHPSGVIPVLGTTDPARVRIAAGAADLRLDRQQWYHIWQAATGCAVA
ncbi:hypothetical protein RD110_15400 [Rhodoferax koreense]|uniref:NADP-dependent oxidoreductase domain-containing protein n=1 Tax=Rhodoferax koreensis TaxID=1842727 RepID=A0A1P8JXC3_9BURK|nr:aldo/keto reductase [Rhodoferax koreense]APW38409.1 hypothetical protein RD110_15400 [Rhodoferax koreense]